MREYAKVSPQFWISEQGRKIKKLGLEAQFLALYLITNPHATMTGVYYLPITLIAHETTLSFDKTSAVLKQLCDIQFCCYDETAEYVWVCDMAADQIGKQLKLTDNRVKSINETYSGLPNLSFLKQYYEKYRLAFFLKEKSSCEDALEGLQSQEQEQYQEQEQEQDQELSMSGKPDVVPLKDFSFEKNKKQQALLKSQACEVLDFLNQKTGRAYRPADSNLKLIMARLKTGATVMDCRLNDQESAETVSNWIGTKDSFTVTAQLNPGQSDGGMGSVRRNKEFIVHPDAIKQGLQVGEAFYVTKVSGFRREKVKVLINVR